MKSELPIIGTNALVDVGEHAVKVPAKVDTGADSSSIWVSDIHIDKNGVLSFKLFGKESPFYTGETIMQTAYKVAIVRSSSGHEQIRYRTELPIRINGKRIRALFNLSDRSKNIFPILIGRRTISGKFLVDVSHKEHEVTRRYSVLGLNKEMQKDPHKFHKKYYKKQLDK